MKALPALFRHLLLMVFCLLTVSTASARSSSEQLERITINQDALDLFVQQNWKGFDALAAQYRNGLQATSGGTQKLVLIYAALRETFANSSEDAEQMADKWIKANPQSPSAYIVKSMMIEARASQLRGDGPIDTVDRTILPEYNKLLARAVKVLLDNKKTAQTDPMWYSQMLMLAKLQGDSAARQQWLQEGSSRYPDFQSIYLEAMIGALPKWGGSQEEIEKVARLAAEKNKDKTGLSLYTYVWYNAFAFQPELMPLLQQNKTVSWADMRQGWNDRLKSYPDQWIRNGYLTCACLAGDKKTFSEQAQKLEGSGNVINQLWLRGLSFQACQSRLR